MVRGGTGAVSTILILLANGRGWKNHTPELHNTVSAI